MMNVCKLLIPVFILYAASNQVTAQSVWSKSAIESRPYKLQTSDRQLRIQSSKNLKDIMLWTLDGNRIVEHKGISSNHCVLEIPTTQKAFFLMVVLHDGKIYTEKIGIR